MSRLRNAFEGLATRGTSKGPDVVFSNAVKKLGTSASELSGQIDQGEEIMISPAIPAPKRPAWIAFAAAFGVVLAVGAVTLLVRPDAQAPSSGQDVAGGGSASVGEGASVDPTVPGVTLAPADSVPMTVPADAPLSYYTYLPDLHLAWRATADGASTEICWKSPAGEGCQSDMFYAPDTIVVPNGSQVIVLTRPDVGGSVSSAEVSFSNGEIATQAFSTPEGIAIAYARFNLPPGGVTVESATALP